MEKASEEAEAIWEDMEEADPTILFFPVVIFIITTILNSIHCCFQTYSAIPLQTNGPR